MLLLPGENFMDLKINDVAALLNLSETAILKLLAQKKIPTYQINNEYRFNRNEIEDWVIKNKMNASASSGQYGSMQYSLYRAIHKGGILYDVPGKTKEEVIKNSMTRIAAQLNLDADILTELILDRENLQSTGLGNGIALPHTRDYLLNTHQDLVVVAFLEQPVLYEALDGKPVHTLFFLFACDDKRHLHLLSKIAHLSSSFEIIRLLQSSPTKEVFLDYIKNWEGNLQKMNDSQP
jgi:nitrogen PTS system EIIA component